MHTVTRDLDIAAHPDEVWERVRSGEWLGDGEFDAVSGGGVDLVDDEGVRRVGAVRAVGDDRSLRFTWWPAGAPTEVSDVDVVVAPGRVGTRVVVTEIRMGGRGAVAVACAGRLALATAR